MSTSNGMTLADFAAITHAAHAQLAEKCAETMKAIVADPNGRGCGTFYNVTLALRDELAQSDPTATLVHQAVRQACYHAANTGLMAPLESVQDDGSITGVVANPPLVWFDPANPPEDVQKLLGTWVDPNAIDPNAPVIDPNATTAGQTLVGMVFATKIPLGNIPSIE